MKGISLFSGAGGFDLGMERAGIEVVYQCEIDRVAASVLARHWPGVPRWGDICTLDPATLPEADVVFFGSPCQDLSKAGQRTGLDGERSGLFHEATRIVRHTRPAFVVWENVTNTFSSNRGWDFGAVLDALAEAGALDIAWRVLDAYGFAVPQARERVFVVADFRGERAGQVLLEPDAGTGATTPSRAAWESAPTPVPAGAYAPGTPVVARPLGAYHYRYDLDLETYAVTAEGVRRLTPREYERLMAWPDDFTRWDVDGKELSDTARYKLCGNGVVANVAEWIGRRLITAHEKGVAP